MRQVIPRRVYRQRRILLYLIGASFHCADCPPQPSGPEPVWRAYLEVVRRELLRHISSKNIGPWATPNGFCKRIIVGLQFSFDVSRQRSAQAAVSGIRQPCFFQMYGEFFLASLSLKPLERLTGLRDRAQYLAGDAYRERADRFITPYLGIPKL